jgi:hypothetical protein
MVGYLPARGGLRCGPRPFGPGGLEAAGLCGRRVDGRWFGPCFLGPGAGADGYAGFGWAAVNEHLDDKTWLALTAETATVADGRLDEPARAAERA